MIGPGARSSIERVAVVALCLVALGGCVSNDGPAMRSFLDEFEPPDALEVIREEYRDGHSGVCINECGTALAELYFEAQTSTEPRTLCELLRVPALAWLGDDAIERDYTDEPLFNDEVVCGFARPGAGVGSHGDWCPRVLIFSDKGRGRNNADGVATVMKC